MLAHVSDHAQALRVAYGNISPATIGAIKRRLLILEEQGLPQFIGEPAVSLFDLIRTTPDGQGMVNVLDVTNLVQKSPRLYGTLLIWLLAELFEELPEVGDLDTPKFAIFVDEAHLLFDGAMASLVDKIEQVVRLIRSKGVGVFFISQSPLDIPAPIAAQLGLKIQHALRAFTPKDRKTLSNVAENFRPNLAFSTLEVLPELGTGEALVSSLDAKGRPLPVEKTLIAPPHSQIGPLDASVRERLIQQSPFYGRFERSVNRESAYELLQQRVLAEQAEVEPAAEPAGRRPAARARTRESAGEAFVKSVSRAVGSQLGRQIVRGILGSIFRKR